MDKSFVSLGLYVIKYAGIVYAVGAVLLGLVFMYYSVRMIKDSSIQNAKRLFYYSIAYLPILIFLIILS